MRNMPPKPLWATWPCPPHVGQAIGLVPGLAPLPWQVSHRSWRVNSTWRWAPLATSSRLIWTWVSRS